MRAMFSSSGTSTPVPPVLAPATQPNVANPGLGLSNSEPLALSGSASPASPPSPLQVASPLAADGNAEQQSDDQGGQSVKPIEPSRAPPGQLVLQVPPPETDTGSLEPSPVYSLPEDVDPGETVQWKLS